MKNTNKYKDMGFKQQDIENDRDIGKEEVVEDTPERPKNLDFPNENNCKMEKNNV